MLPAARANLKRASSHQTPGHWPKGPEKEAFKEAQKILDEVSRQYLDSLVRHRRSMYRLNTAVGHRIFP